MRFHWSVSWEAHRWFYKLMLVDGGRAGAITFTIAKLEAALIVGSQHDANGAFIGDSKTHFSTVCSAYRSSQPAPRQFSNSNRCDFACLVTEVELGASLSE